jgi:hypothetical protein
MISIISTAGLKALILSAMTFLSPVKRDYHPEDPSMRAARFEQVAQDIAEVSLDQDTQSIFKGQFGRVHTALFITSVAFNESGFRKDIDEGEKRGDHGHAYCLMQIHPNQPPFNFTPEYLADRKNCINAGIKMIIAHRCSTNDMRLLMHSYVSGQCEAYDDPKKELLVARTSANEAFGYVRFRKHLDDVRFKFENLLESDDEGRPSADIEVENRILALAKVIKTNEE